MKALALLLASFLYLYLGGPAGANNSGQKPKEITIHLRGNKTMTAALQDAVDKGTTVTGVADFDSLSAVYGLVGIYREGVTGFYGHRFRLKFPPDSDVVLIDRAYHNLPYIKPFRSIFDSRSAITRIPGKIALGVAVGGATFYTIALAGIPISGGFLSVVVAVPMAQFVGYPLGIYLADRESDFPAAFGGAVLGYWVGTKLSDPDYFGRFDEPFTWIFLSFPIITSELSRFLPDLKKAEEASRSSKISFGVYPGKSELSVSTTLRF